MQKHTLIINADDFGMNSEVNAGIVECFRKGLIDSTTIMVTMPYFKEALALADMHGFKDKVGIHINLTEGRPLTNLNGTGLVDQSGNFILKEMLNPLIIFSRNKKNKIKIEIYEQYKTLIENNLNPSHIDSHQHVHHLPWMAPLFFSLAIRERKKIRLRSTKFAKNLFKTFYSFIFNRRLKKMGLNFSDLFGNLKYCTSYIKKSKNIRKSMEMMVHPTIHNNMIIDRFNSGDFESTMKDIKTKYEFLSNNNY